MTTFALDDMHPQMRAYVSLMLTDLCARYPMAKLREVGTYEPAPTDRSAADASRPGRILFSLRWFGQDPGVLQEAAEEDEVQVTGATGPVILSYHGGMPEPRHMVYHEFGHILSDGLPGWKNWATDRWEAATADPHLAPSGYALASPDEYWGEAFAAYHLVPGAGFDLHEFLTAALGS